MKKLSLLILLATVAVAQQPVKRDLSCSAASASGTDYTCSITSAPSGYVTGERYFFLADVANTVSSGKPTVNFNALGAKQIVKMQGAITTALAANDIRANQWVALIYDGTNMQMLSQTGASSGTILYNTAATGNTAGIGSTSMFTVGGSDATFAFQLELSQEINGVCSAFPLETAKLIYTDAASGLSSTVAALPYFKGGGTQATNFQTAATAGLTTLFLGEAIMFRAKAGTTISFSVTESGSPSCTTYPTWSAFPVLRTN